MNRIWRLLIGRWGLLWACLCYAALRLVLGRSLNTLEIVIWSLLTYMVGSIGAEFVARATKKRST